REMNSWKWFGIAVGYQCLFAYVIALIVYQFGILFAGRANIIGLIVASVCVVGLAYLLFRKNKYIKQ
ncbi:MAG: hypothetical protein IJ883_04040, partial [Eubacterium sp.]|nr:hypothetical protein [Eubacterium sp.]